MAIQKRVCTNHPDRPAIGVCVITRKAICVECSTRYEGVNYSKEALAILQQRRAAAAKSGRGGQLALTVLAWCLAPVMVYLLYFAYVVAANALINLLRGET
jgi:hypothetical protein